MPGMNGIEATRRIKESSPETAVLALTMHEDEQLLCHAPRRRARLHPKRRARRPRLRHPRVVAEGNFFPTRRWRAS